MDFRRFPAGVRLILDACRAAGSIDFDLFGPNGWLTMGRVAIHTSVEDCLRLDTASDAVRPRLRLGSVSSGRWTWSRDGEPFAAVGYTVNGLRGERLALELDYKVSGRPVRQFIALVKTSPHYGGIRWWFLCPVEFAGGVERRVRCLYLPAGQTSFASRVAHNLNYESQKVSCLSRTIARLLKAGS